MNAAVCRPLVACACQQGSSLCCSDSSGHLSSGGRPPVRSSNQARQGWMLCYEVMRDQAHLDPPQNQAHRS